MKDENVPSECAVSWGSYLKISKMLAFVLPVLISIGACGDSASSSSANLTVTGATDSANVLFQTASGGAWSAVSVTGGNYKATLASTSTPFGMAIYCQNTNTTQIIQGTIAEVGNKMNPVYCAPIAGSVTGSVSNVTGADTAKVVIGNNNNWSATSTPTLTAGAGTYSLSGISSGTYDVAAVESDTSGNVVKVLIARNQTISSNAYSHTFDMSTATSVSATNTLSAISQLGLTSTGSAALVTSNGTSIPVNNVANYAVVPGTSAGDVYIISMQVSSGASFVTRNNFYDATTNPGNITIDLSGITFTSKFTFGAGPAVSALSYTPSNSSPGSKAFQIKLGSGSALGSNITVTPGYLGSGTIYTIPSFTAAGYPSWNLTSANKYNFTANAVMPNWNFSRTGGNLTGDSADYAGVNTTLNGAPVTYP